MHIDQAIFKSYDIRGIYPTQLNETNIIQIARAIHHFFLQKLGKTQVTCVIGHDMRVSSPSLFKKVRDTLVSEGAQVIDIGLCSTPTFYFAVHHYRFDCGMQVTASHNPKEYNGIKFVMNSPNGLIKIGKLTGMEEVEKLLNEQPSYSQHKGGVTVITHVIDDEVNFAFNSIKKVKLRAFTTVADPANAMGSTYIEALFKKIPGKLVKMNFDLDGTFPVHQPDPLDYKNLVDLQSRVVSEKADFGLAPDGDGDRLFFIDEKGGIVPPSVITGLIARELLKENLGAKILFDIRYLITPRSIVEEAGGKYEVTKVGHSHITEQMNNTGAIFAGESSGHYFYRTTGNAESQVMTICYLLKILSETGKPLSQLVDENRRSFESGEINFTAQDSTRIVEEAIKTYQDGDISRLDGVAISYPTWRFSLRSSNTEPLLRLNVEATTREELQEKKNQLVHLIESLIEKV